MNETQAEEMLATLKRIEQLLMYVANHTQDAVPYNHRQGMTRFYPQWPIQTSQAK